MLPDTSDDLADLYHELARRGELFGFEATERFFEKIRTPESLAETGAFLWPRFRGQTKIASDRAGIVKATVG